MLQPEQQPAFTSEDYEAEHISLTDALAQHLTEQETSLAEFRAKSPLDIVTTLDGFVRIQTRLRDDHAPLLPAGMSRLVTAGYLADITAAPAHQPKLVRDWAPFALKNAPYFRQVTVTVGLFHELRGINDPLQTHAANLLAITGMTISKIRRSDAKDWRSEYGIRGF